MTTQAVVSWAQAQILAASATSKIQRAPAYPDDQALTVPTSIAWADNIRFLLNSKDFKQTLFDLRIQVVIPRGDLEMAQKFFEGVPLAIGDIFRKDPTFGGNADTYNGDVTARFIVGKTVMGMDCMGYDFMIANVKLNE